MAQRGARQQQPELFDYAAQWADIPDTEELTLSTGKKLVVQSPDMAVLAKNGLIPNHLLPIVEQFVITSNLIGSFNNFAPAVKEGEAPGAALVRSAELNEYIDFFCVAAAVDPALSLDGKPGTTKVTKLSRQERFEVWDWGVGLTKAVATFRELTTRALADVAAARDGESLRDAAEPGAGADPARGGVAGVSSGHGDGVLGPLRRKGARHDGEARQAVGAEVHAGAGAARPAGGGEDPPAAVPLDGGAGREETLAAG